jgi:hypothetical protein
MGHWQGALMEQQMAAHQVRLPGALPLVLVQAWANRTLGQCFAKVESLPWCLSSRRAVQHSRAQELVQWLWLERLD